MPASARNKASIMQSSKPQFGPWLMEQVRSGLYDGVYMLDNNTFRISWKHNSRKDCVDEDNKLFKAWAVVSGKIHENPSDKTKWKTNFRCALHSLKQFEKLKDNSKDSDDPHKVYEIVRPKNNYESQNIDIAPPNQPYHIQDIYNTADQSHNPLQENMEHDDLLNHIDSLDLNHQQSGIQQWEPYPYPNTANNYFLPPLPVAPQPVSQNNMPVPMQPAYCSVNHMVNLPALSPLGALEVSIHYRRTEMLKAAVSGPLQLHYQCDPSQLRGHPLCFPSTEQLNDHKQVQYTKCILDSIQRGLLLQVNTEGVYGIRQDKCHVFASTSDPTELQSPEPRKLQQNRLELLLNFNTYKNDLMAFKENKRGSPDYTIYLCFGEKFPDGKPLEKKLIVVKVVPLICRELHERAQREGASSLQTDAVSLQISHNSLFDLIHETFSPPPTDGCTGALF